MFLVSLCLAQSHCLEMRAGLRHSSWLLARIAAAIAHWALTASFHTIQTGLVDLNSEYFSLQGGGGGGDCMAFVRPTGRLSVDGALVAMGRGTAMTR